MSQRNGRALAAAIGVLCFGGAQAAFAPYETTATGSWADAVAVGDVDADGRPDVVVSTTSYFSPNDYSVFIFAGQPDGTLAATPVRVPYNAMASRNGLAIVDLDGDARAEIVVGHGTGLSVLRRDAASGAWSASVVSGGAAADNVALVDVNVDGRPDVAALPWTGPIRVYVNDGAGGFLPNPLQVASINAGYNTMRSADLDGDGHRDLVVQSGQGLGPAAAVHLHDGAGGFLPYATIDRPANESAGGLAIGDLNGDLRPDIALSGSGNRPVDVFVSYQTENGSFGPPQPYPTYDIPETMFAGDLDGNGLDDLLVLHGGWSRAGLYAQSRLGLAPETLWQITYASHYGPTALAVGDVLRNDQCPDAFIADYNYGLVKLAGTGCVQADLAAAVTFLADTFDVVVRHVGGDTAAIEPITAVELAFSSLKHVRVEPPAGCVARPAPLPTLAFDCWSDDVAIGGSRTYAFRAQMHRRTAVTVRATTSSPTRDLVPENNTATLSLRQ
jgi:hypothetical protein